VEFASALFRQHSKMQSTNPNDTNQVPYYPQSPPPQAYPQPAPYNDADKAPYYPPQSPPPPQNNWSGPPQYPGPPNGGAMYYPQGQPMTAYPPPPQQQQQQSVVVVGAANPTPMIIQQVPIESYGGHQAFACVVLWCCNWLFGLIAWILALTAEHSKFTDREQARRLGKASIGMSISGIIVTAIVVGIAVGVSVGRYNTATTSYSYSNTCAYYKVNGVCYSYRRYISTSCYTYYSSYSNCCDSTEYYYSYYCYW
jgi:hypothetical protein